MITSSINVNSKSPGLRAIVFLLFSVALSWAIFSALGQSEIDYARVIRLIWTSLAFFIVAIVRFITLAGRTPLDPVWRLTWTASFALYFIHFLYGFIFVHEGSLGALYAHQGIIIATSNLLLTLLWANSIFRTWFLPSRERAHFRFLTHVAVLLAFLISTLVFGSFVAKALSGIMLVCTGGALLYRRFGKNGSRLRSGSGRNF